MVDTASTVPPPTDFADGARVTDRRLFDAGQRDLEGFWDSVT